MDLSSLLRKGISIRTQQPGLLEDGPISSSLKALARTVREGTPHPMVRHGDKASLPISLIGAQLASIITQRRVRVIFTDTGGSGVAPWRGWIILDSKYQGDGQINSPAAVAKVGTSGSAGAVIDISNNQLDITNDSGGDNYRPAPAQTGRKLEIPICFFV